MTPGDVVVMRSGGPILVMGDVGTTHCEVMWFAGALLQRAFVRLEALRPARREDYEAAGLAAPQRGAEA